RHLFLTATWSWHGRVEEINCARQNRSDPDVTVWHPRASQSIEKSLRLKETARRLKHDQISVPRCIMQVVKRHNLKVRPPAGPQVIGHAHRSCGCDRRRSGRERTHRLRYLARVKLGHLIHCKVSRDVLFLSAN